MTRSHQGLLSATLGTAAIAFGLAFGAPAGPAQAAGERPRAARAAPAAAPWPAQHGRASYYHHRFKGRRMANGERFDPAAPIAAHRTLPLGTLVRVTNLGNGRSAVVHIADRGPRRRGRLIDLAPGVAQRLGMREEGVVQVAVTPLRLPEQVAEGR